MKATNVRLTVLIMGTISLIGCGAAFGDDPPIGQVEWLIGRGEAPSLLHPGMIEVHYSIGAMNAWSCDGRCPNNCAPSGCSPTTALTIDCSYWYCVAPPGRHFLHCFGDFESASYVCIDHVHNCILVYANDVDCIAHMWDDVHNGYDGSTGITRYGFPPLRPAITIDTCKIDGMSPDWIPEYGDILCFEIGVNVPMDVIVRLSTSTYEGMAMNAGVPESDPDTVSDIVPWLVEGCISLAGLDGYFTWSGGILPNEPRCIYMRVQDYGANAALEAWKDGDFTVRDAVQIPCNYERFLNNGDPDLDGLTNWEEYRGFILGSGSHIGARPGGGIDSTLPDLFVDDQTNFIWTQGFVPLIDATGYQPINAGGCPMDDIQLRHFIDSKCHLQGEFYELCDAGFNPPAWPPPGEIAGFDQAIVRFEFNNLMDDTLGRAHQYEINGDPRMLFNGPAGNLGSIEINYYEHLSVISVLQLEPHCLPPELAGSVLTLELARTYLHELGHTLGIPEHIVPTEGYRGCVMKYETDSDYPYVNGWESFTWGEGYLNDSPNLCADSKALRP